MLKQTLFAIGAAFISLQAIAANSIVEMKTSMGNIEIELFNDKAPISAKNFESYIKDNFYNGTIFHRVIPGFMIQGGGMDANMVEKQTKAPIQFFINTVDNDFLNKSQMNAGYAVFGKVIKGMDVVDKITKVPTANFGMHQNVPKQAVKIISVTVKAAPEKN